MIQVLINILIIAFIYLLISYSFIIIYNSTKFFHLTHAAITTFGAYLTLLFSDQFGLPLLLAIPLAIIFTSLTGINIERLIYRPLRQRNSHPFILLIVSLGLYIILQNIISLGWGNSIISIRTGDVKVGNEVWGGYITDIQISIIFTCLFLFIASIIIIKKTKLGKQLRAISSNDELANIFGINSNKIILWAFGIGSAIAAVAGILIAFDTDMTPTMGFNILLYGVVAMIIGGVGSTWGIVGGSLLLATAQHLGAYYIDSKWMDAIAYIILILFLIWKPLGFSGKRLKKIEI